MHPSCPRLAAAHQHAPAGVAWAHRSQGVLAAVLSRPFKPVDARVLVAAARR